MADFPFHEPLEHLITPQENSLSYWPIRRLKFICPPCIIGVELLKLLPRWTLIFPRFVSQKVLIRRSTVRPELGYQSQHLKNWKGITRDVCVLLIDVTGSRNSAVRIATSYGVGDEGTGVRLSARHLYPFWDPSIGYRESFTKEWSGCWMKLIIQFQLVLKSGKMDLWIYAPYAFMIWCLIC
jgi:hypothetical protein